MRLKGRGKPVSLFQASLRLATGLFQDDPVGVEAGGGETGWEQGKGVFSRTGARGFYFARTLCRVVFRSWMEYGLTMTPVNP